MNFILASVIAGIWGIFIANRGFTFGASGVADPTLGGDTLTLESIAAAVIGGTSLLGGSGTVIGALAGSMLIAVLQDGLILVGATAYIYQTLLGAAIIFCMSLNILARKWARR
jgi:simple sugar transport system permease protein